MILWDIEDLPSCGTLIILAQEFHHKREKNSNENIWFSPEALEVVLTEGAPADVAHGGQDHLARHPGHACADRWRHSHLL